MDTINLAAGETITVSLGSGVSYAIVTALAGIALFVFTIKILGNSLKELAGPKFKKALLNISSNRFIAMLFGALFTTTIQSSDGVMAIIMGLLAAGLIDMKGAVAFLLGANIGTATTSLLVSFQSELKFTHYFFILAFIGVFGYLLFNKKKQTQFFMVVLAIGLIFLSLAVLGGAVKSIAKVPEFTELTKKISANPWISYPTSIFLTGTLQSSSATVAIYQTVYKASLETNSMSLASAIALVLGANVGTTFTGLIVAWASKNKDSKRIALTWGLTNLSISLVIMILIPWYAQLIEMLVPSGATFQLSIAHLLFNAILVSIYIWLIDPVVKLMYFLIKDPVIDSKYKIELSDTLLTNSPDLAAESAGQALLQAGNLTRTVLSKLHVFTTTGSYIEYKQLLNYQKILKSNLQILNTYLMKLVAQQLDLKESKKTVLNLMVFRSMDSINELVTVIENEIIKSYSKSKNQFKMDKELVIGISSMAETNLSLFELSLNQLKKYDLKNNKKITNLSQNTYNLTMVFTENYLKNKTKDLKNIKNSKSIKELEEQLDYIGILKNFDRIAHRSVRINNYVQNSKTSKITILETATF